MAVSADVRPSAKKGVVKNVFSLLVVQVSNYVFPLLTVPVVSRIIGPDKLGVINWAAAFMTYFTILINFGFDLSATRAIAAQRDNLAERNRIFNEVMSAKALLFGISTILFLLSLFFFPQLRDEKLVAIFSFLVCFSWMITPNWLYQGMQELSRTAVFNLVTKVLFTAVIFMVIRKKQDYVWQPLAISMAQIAVGFFSFFFAIKRYNITVRFAKLKPVLTLLWNERLLFFSMVVVSLYTTTNTVLLGFMQSSEQVGYYTAGWRLIMIVQQMISIPIGQSLYPFIGAAFADSKERGMAMVRQVVPIVVGLTAVASVVLLLMSGITIKIFYGEKFLPAINVLRVLAFVPMIITFSNLLGVQTMLNLKMDKIFFRVTAGGAVVCILLNLILVKPFGYMGTAWCWLMSEFFISVTMFIILTRKGVHIIEPRYFTPAYFRKFLSPIILKVRQRVK